MDHPGEEQQCPMTLLVEGAEAGSGNAYDGIKHSQIPHTAVLQCCPEEKV